MNSSSRPRPPRACARCAQRKVSCDKARPSCSRCIQAGFQCHYTYHARSVTSHTTILDETQHVLDQMTVPRRLSSVDHMPPDFRQETCDTPEISTGPVSTSTSADPGQLHLGAQTKSTYRSPSSFASLGREINVPQRRGRYTVHRPSATESSAHSSNHIAPSSTSSHARNLLADAAQRLYGDIFQMSPLGLSQDEELRIGLEDMSLSNILNGLPMNQCCEELIRAYLRGYHTVRPLFNMELFLRQAQELSLWRAGLTTNYSPGAHFLALYAAVVFAGCTVSPRSTLVHYFGPQSRERLSSRLYNQAVCAIRLADFPKSPSLWTFASFIILNSTWLREEQPLHCCSFIGLAFRVAQMLGLHREPARFGIVSSADIQVRRHLWWSIVTLDSQIALSSGLPPMIESQLYKIEHPDEHEEPITLPSQPQDMPRGSKTVLGVFVGGRYTFYRHMSDILRIVNGYHIQEANVDELLRLTGIISREMDRRKQELLSITWLPQENTSGQPITTDELRGIQMSPSLASFATKVLTMLAAKPFAIMYGPLKQHGMLQYMKNKEPGAVGYCRLFLHEFIKLAQNQEFQPWHWSWPGQHQPLHSILALVTELEEHPDDSLAGETRKLVDLALSMCESSSDGGITSSEGGDIDLRPLTDGGVEAWNIIRKARDEVWEQSGLDSNSLYCPESAEDINIGNSTAQISAGVLQNAEPSDFTDNHLSSSIAWPETSVLGGLMWPDQRFNTFSSNYER